MCETIINKYSLLSDCFGILKTTSRQVQVTVSAEEFGAKEKSPYNSYICSDIPSSSLSDIIR